MSAAVLMEVAEASDAIDFDAGPDELLHKMLRTAMNMMSSGPTEANARAMMIQVAAIAVRFAAVIDAAGEDGEDGAT